jgi:competence protein ComEC
VTGAAAAGIDEEEGGRTSLVRRTSLAGLLERLLHGLNAEQDRWFLWIPVLFGLGSWTYFALPTEPRLLLASMLAAVAIVLSACWRRGNGAIVVTGAALALALGFGAAKLRTTWVAGPVLERQLTGVEVAGFVEAAEQGATRGQRITVFVTRLGTIKEDARPRRIRVRMLSREPVLKPGDAVRIKATLAPPALPAAPGDYDFARAAWFRGLGAIGYAVARPVLDQSAQAPPMTLVAAAAIERLRQIIGDRVRAALPGERGAIATALITGERGGISQATTDAFRDSGLIHILSISGLHMAVMAGAVFYVVRLGLAAIPAIALRFPIKKWAAAAAIVGALCYLLISGSSIATVRSWIMITIMFAAVMLDRPGIALRNVAVAALVILAIAPESLFDAGFQMSFAAVVALVSAYELLRERAAAQPRGPAAGGVLKLGLFFGGIVLTTVIASLAVAPFSAYHFHKSQQYAVLANLIAIPLCNALVMPASLATLVFMPFGLEAVPLWVMGAGIDGMVWCAKKVAELPGAVARIPAFSHVAFALMILGGLWLCLWRRPWRLLGLAVVAAGLGLTPLGSRPDVLVGHDGQLLAVRGPDGRLWSPAASGSTFELQRWLERDGDPRSAREAINEERFRCDGQGCITTVSGRVLAAARHAAALADDCARAALLVLSFPAPRGCRPSLAVIDFFAVRREGTHALYLNADSPVIETVAAVRGDRPWTRRAASIPPPAERGSPPRASRLHAFAPRIDLGGSPGQPRPEVEDEDAPEMDDLGDRY